MRLFDGCEMGDPLTMSDGSGLAKALPGLDGFRVLGVHEATDEVVIAVETTAVIAWCAGCGARAQVHDRTRVEVRDLACFGQPGTAGVAQATVALSRASV